MDTDKSGQALEPEYQEFLDRMLAPEGAQTTDAGYQGGFDLDGQDDEEPPQTPQQAAGYQTYEVSVPEFRAKDALKRLSVLSAKAVKLGMPPFEISYGEPVATTRIIRGEKVRVAEVPFTVVGGPPKIPGWQFVAKIEHDTTMNEVMGFGAQRMIDENPELFKKLTTCPPNCEHCNLKRDRNTTYLFLSDEGDKTIQVGSSCMDDFTGHDDPRKLLMQANQFVTVMDELSDPDEMYEGASGFKVFDTRDVWAAAAALIREDGRWVSRDRATDMGSSADWVTQILMDTKVFDKMVKPVDFETADHVQSWLTDENFDPGTNLYLHNLRVMAQRGYVKAQAIGFAGSAVASWGREQSKARTRQGTHEKLASVALGEEGERLEREVRVEKKIAIDTHFGMSTLHIMRDLETNGKITWFNSGYGKFAEGDTYTITGRVKQHQTRDGLLETQLTRVNSPDLALHNKIDEGMNEKALIKKARKLKHIDARDADGESLLHVVSHFYHYRQQGKELMADLLERGADPSLVSWRDDLSAFDHWLLSGDEDLIRIALAGYPELTKPWTDEQLDAFGLTEEEMSWVAELKAVRNRELAAEQTAKIETETPTVSQAETDSEPSALDALRGGKLVDSGERIDLTPAGTPTQGQSEPGDDEDEDDSLRLA